MVPYNHHQDPDEAEKQTMAEFFQQGGVVMRSDPTNGVTIEEIQVRFQDIQSEQELADAYALVHNKFWWVEDDVYDYEVGTADYIRVRGICDAWGAFMDTLGERIERILRTEVPSGPSQTTEKTAKHVLYSFMARYGYRDGAGWWVKDK